MAVVVATLALTSPASRPAASAGSHTTGHQPPRATEAPTIAPVARAAASPSFPPFAAQTLGVAAMVEPALEPPLAGADATEPTADSATPPLADAEQQAQVQAPTPDATSSPVVLIPTGDSRPPASAAPTTDGTAPPTGATETLGPPSGGSPGPVATTSPSPYANDTLTDIAKVPGAQWINWPAYTPQPHKPAVPTLKGTGTFLWPTSGFISTPFKPEHQAIDIANDLGTPIYAADTGTVVFADVDYGGLGNATEIDHGNGYVTTYGHQSKLLVKEGDVVVRGQLIGLMGSTGHSTGPHLHFVIKKDGQTLNPLLYVKQGLPPPPPAKVAVPDFTNMPAAKAVQVAQTYRLSLKVVDTSPSKNVTAGDLFGQDPTPNSLIDVSATVALHVSSGQPTPTPTATATPTAASTSASAVTAGAATQTAQGSPTAGPSATASSSPSPMGAAPAASPTRAAGAPQGTAIPSATPLPVATSAQATKPAGNKQ